MRSCLFNSSKVCGWIYRFWTALLIISALFSILFSSSTFLAAVMPSSPFILHWYQNPTKFSDYPATLSPPSTALVPHSSTVSNKCIIIQTFLYHHVMSHFQAVKALCQFVLLSVKLFYRVSLLYRCQYIYTYMQ